MSLREWVSKGAGDTTTIVNIAFDKAVKQTNAALDSDTTKDLKERTIAAMGTARNISKNLSDLNGDGKVDGEDLKLAAKKAGIAWDSIDPDLKSALLAGGAAGIGVNIIPIVGQAIAVPAFIGTTAYFYIVAKLTKIKVSGVATSERLAVSQSAHGLAPDSEMGATSAATDGAEPTGGESRQLSYSSGPTPRAEEPRRRAEKTTRMNASADSEDWPEIR